MFGYRQRVLTFCTRLLAGRGAGLTALDMGSGDGWFAHRFAARGVMGPITAVDVSRRRAPLVEPILYDGTTLPFADRAFDIVYAIDVLHHCADPVANLHEAMRCADRYLLLKDHVYETRIGRFMLCALDEMGNRAVGVPSPYHYQHRWDWLPVIEAAGFVPEGLIHPAHCHPLAPRAASSRLQFVGLWRRAETAA